MNIVNKSAARKTEIEIYLRRKTSPLSVFYIQSSLLRIR